MVDDEEWGFIERSATDHSHDHVLIGTSLPWLLAPGMHHLEAWSEAISEGAWGRPGKLAGEYLREALDLEHWAAFGDSFQRLTALIERIARGDDGPPPATIVALSGDVHHSYLAEVAFPRSAAVRSRVYQAVCSPFRNPLDSRERTVIRAMTSRPAGAVMRALARSAGVADPPVRWRKRQDPVFDKVVATQHQDGRDAALRIDRAPATDGGTPRLENVFRGDL
jgi:hypothetical protein